MHAWVCRLTVTERRKRMWEMGSAHQEKKSLFCFFDESDWVGMLFYI